MKVSRETTIYAATLVLLIVVGILLVGDYGMMIDDDTSRINGLVNLRYILNRVGIDTDNITILSDLPELNNWVDRDYGAFIEIVGALMELLLGLDSEWEIYQMRHLLVYSLFSVSAVSFGSIFLNRYQSGSVYLLATILYFTSPRIFAHAFFNTKDIGCLALTTISVALIYAYRRKPSSRLFLWLAALTIAAATNVRLIVALIPVFFVAITFFELFVSKKGEPWTVIIFSVLCFLFYFTATPYLWESPISNFLETLGNMSNFTRWPGETFFMGKWFRGGSTPGYFIPLWIVITISLPTIVGVILLTVGAKSNKLKWDWFDLSLIGLMVVSIIIVWLLKSVVYNDWRQLFFVHLPLTFLATQGFVWFTEVFKAIKINVSLFLIGLTLFLSTRTIAKFHPYEYCYFNGLVNNPHENFEVDYCRLSYKQAVEKLTQTESDEHSKPKVYFHEMRGVEFGFSSETEVPFESWPLEDADYVITNNKYHPEFFSGYELIDSTYIGNVEVNQTFRVPRIK